jgi:hypothetical protein
LASNARVSLAEEAISTINERLYKKEETTDETGEPTIKESGLTVEVESLNRITESHGGRLNALELLHKDSDLKLSEVQEHITESEKTLSNHEARITALEGFAEDLNDINIPDNYVSKDQF